jgi:hypothetical protein
MPFRKDVTVQLAAAVTTGIALAQSGTAGTALTLNGSLVSGGVATLDAPRRVIITPAANESANVFTITGTDVYGRTQVEALNGVASGSAVTAHDFATVTSIVPTNNTSGTVTSGTNGTGSSIPYIVSAYANPNLIGVFVELTGTVTFSIEKSGDYFGPAWDLNTNTPIWFADSGFTSLSANTSGQVQGPLTMIRLTVTSGTGSATARFLQAYISNT